MLYKHNSFFKRYDTLDTNAESAAVFSQLITVNLDFKIWFYVLEYHITKIKNKV